MRVFDEAKVKPKTINVEHHGCSQKGQSIKYGHVPFLYQV